MQATTTAGWASVLMAVAIAAVATTTTTGTTAEETKTATPIAAATPTTDGTITVSLALATTSTGEQADGAGSSGPLAVAPLFLNKCCKRNQRLDDNQRNCIVFENATQESEEYDQEQESLATLMGRGLPWWIDTKIKKALQNASSDSVVRYGIRSCDYQLTSAKWSNEIRIYSNGSLMVQLWSSLASEKKRILLLSPADFCVDRTYVGGKPYVAYQTCPCAHVPCVRKCCDLKKMLTLHPSVALAQEADCQERLNGSLNFTLQTDAHEPANVSYALLRGPFASACESGRKRIALDSRDIETADIVILSNGSLTAKVLGSPFLPKEYCVDQTKSPYTSHVRLWALVCAKMSPPKAMDALDAVYVALYVVGFLSLVATLVVYALLPSLRRPTNAKALMSHAAALAVALLVLCVSRFVRQVQVYAYCASLAFISQFFLLAAFCWLSVLCFDIARGLSAALRPVDSSSGAACRRLLFYSLFAWGAPGVIVAVSIYLNFAKGLSRQVLRPDIGKQGCWFSKGNSMFAFYYGPVAFLLLANVAMFSFTMVKLRMAQREMVHLKNEEGQLSGGALRRRRERLLLYAKLFSLMGVTWLLEVLAWAVGAGRIVVFIIDTINVLRGVGVFVACCCKREVLKSLRNMMPCGEKPPMAERGQSYTVTTTLSVSTPDAVRVRRVASVQTK